MDVQEFDEQIDRIRRYNDCLSRHAEDENHPKIQYYIGKLRKLPIKVEHLLATGIGESVNQLRRRFDGKTKDLARECVDVWKEMVKLELARQEELEEKAKAEEAKKKILMKEEQERISREKRDKNAAPNHSEHHVSSSHQPLAESKHKSHKRSYSSDNDRQSKKLKEDHNNNDKHHKSHDHHSKYDEKKNEHRCASRCDAVEKHKSKSKEFKDRHKKDTKERERGQVKQQEKERAKDRNNEKDQSKKDKTSDKPPKKEFSEDKQSPSGSSKSKSDIDIVNGIDSGSGASFAEALGMCEQASSRSATSKKEITKRKSSSSPENESKSKKEKPSSSASHCLSKQSSQSKLNPEPDLSSSPTDPKDSLPTLLKEPAAALDPIDLNIPSLMTTTTPYYRPVGTMTMSGVASKKLSDYKSDYETLSLSITSKKQRIKMYSGNKSASKSDPHGELRGEIPSLFDTCIRMLQDNIDSLRFTGGIPFFILKPILDKATANQLYLLEHHNPYLIEDTDDLWHLHCQKYFRNKQRLELESWREMFLRYSNEHKAKLEAVTANIKQAQDKLVPARKAELAFVNGMVKPPRNVARQQAKNCSGRFSSQFTKRPLITPSSRLSTLATPVTSGEAGKVSAKVSLPNPAARAVECSSASKKPAKMAPLMAKSLSLMKNLKKNGFRR